MKSIEAPALVVTVEKIPAYLAANSRIAVLLEVVRSHCIRRKKLAGCSFPYGLPAGWSDCTRCSQLVTYELLMRIGSHKIVTLP